jgi:hypothetical protein
MGTGRSSEQVKRRPRRRSPVKQAGVRRGKMRPADPFELIRWLARSQPDPRKALAELVQNSLDAGARKVTITRQRRAGQTELRILDDGEGVVPELPREEALGYLATHVGHSRKRDLTPEQRRDLMMQGKYGIGLLGFWAIGEELQIRTHIAGEPAMVLTLHEDSPEYEIARLRGKLALGERWTEVLVRRMHAAAFKSLTGRRIADFLATELRGQLLAHRTQVVVHDRIVRGRAAKHFEVTPRRFDGERLPLALEIETEGFGPVLVELYANPSRDGERRAVALAQAGTVVYDDIGDFELADLARSPWSDPRLSGVIDFAAFQVPPGARRAVVPDAAAAAFVAALTALEPAVVQAMAALDAREQAEVEKNLIRQLDRAFRDVPRAAPEYDFFALADAEREALASRSGGRGGGPQAGTPQGTDGNGRTPAGEATPPVDEHDEHDDDAGLAMAGGLVLAEIVPAGGKIERLAKRRLRLVARDAAGLPISRALDVEWAVDGPDCSIVESGPRTAELTAGSPLGKALVRVSIMEGARLVEAAAEFSIVEPRAGVGEERTGIPEPTFVDDGRAGWRSRMVGTRWEVNSGHDDFRAAAVNARRQLRYLASLLAKEVVLHSFPAPNAEPLLERLVQVLAIADRRLEKG